MRARWRWHSQQRVIWGPMPRHTVRNQPVAILGQCECQRYRGHSHLSSHESVSCGRLDFLIHHVALSCPEQAKFAIGGVEVVLDLALDPDIRDLIRTALGAQHNPRRADGFGSRLSHRFGLHNQYIQSHPSGVPIDGSQRESSTDHTPDTGAGRFGDPALCHPRFAQGSSRSTGRRTRDSSNYNPKAILEHIHAEDLQNVAIELVTTITLPSGRCLMTC